MVFTGEGSIDFQTKFGKTPAGVAETAKRHGKPVIAVAGHIGTGIDELHEVGIEDEENFAAMAKKAAAGCVGSFVPLEENDIVEIYRAAL